ncbi:MAG: hypothetical protein ABH835_04275 [Patescibacteria group bacterium]
MKTNTDQKIIDYLAKNKQATAKELVDYLGISKQALFKNHLSKLLEKGKITKIGKPPKVFYLVKTEDEEVKKVPINSEIREIINEKYLIITPYGERKKGLEGFIYWCQKNDQPINKTAIEYVKTLRKYDSFRKYGFIEGINKLQNTFSKVYLDDLFYLDFYSIERFGKTRLGQLLLYAKQTQNKKIIQELILEIKSEVNKLIKKYRIDGVGFIPPTLKREIQFMKELEEGLSLNINKIKITKIKTEIIIPQKSLSKLKDRIENIKKTLIVEEKTIYNNILLIDDAVGSGATMNEAAKQIRKRKICQNKIIGLSITGSFKGFDVISEI